MVFDWHAVDPPVTRALLTAAYRSYGLEEQAQDAGRASSPAQAEHSLGRPIRRDFAVALAPTLIDAWVPRLLKDDLAYVVRCLKLSVTGPLRRQDPATRAEMIAWIGAPKITSSYALQLLNCFTVLHKTDNGSRRVPGKSTPKRAAGAIRLQGATAHESLEPHDYQSDAWLKLDDLARISVRASGHFKNRHAGGLVVIPTGGGKTFTAVHWLTDLIAENPAIRVLWLADRKELVDQAAREFENQGSRMPVGTERVLRVVHGSGSPRSLLADPTVDIVCATRQSVIGRTFDATAKKALREFLLRPIVVVVDEAHHGVSTTYRKLLDYIEAQSTASLLIGLTATPWPAGHGKTAALHDRFPTTVVTVDASKLIADQILARPIVHTLQTGQHVTLSAADRTRLGGAGDLPDDILRKLDTEARNQLIVDAWLQDRKRWGKTLVFACNIKHADRLGEMFRAANVTTDVVHSASSEPLPPILTRFKKSTSKPRVLISVDVLREGVNLPDARTAFLTRPTQSPIVLRQMVGRVLRGPKAGGEPDAHLVDLRDKWQDDVDILSPVELSGLEFEEDLTDETAKRRLPPLLDEGTKEPVPGDVVAHVARAYREAGASSSYLVALRQTRLTGFYQLDERNVPVFEHAQPRWTELLTTLTGKKASHHSAVALFGDLPVPRPLKTEVDAVVEYVRSYATEPPFIAISLTISAYDTAQALVTLPAMTELDRRAWLVTRYEESLARTAYPDFTSFRQAVEQQLDVVTALESRRLNPEAPSPSSRTKLRTLKAVKTRKITPLFDAAVITGREILKDDDPSYRAYLKKADLPDIEWTRRPVGSTFAYWAPRISGKGKGKPVIRVNRALQAVQRQVPNSVLEYLIWHELCHHILPGHGHDAEFRRLEARWENSASLDAQIDLVGETYHLDRGSS